jgi:hypothetical protein
LVVFPPTRGTASTRSSRWAGSASAPAPFAGLLVSENGGLFGFSEQGYRGAIVLSIGFDVATVVFLGAFLALRALADSRARVSAGGAWVTRA